MRRFHDITIHSESKEHLLSEEESKHIVRVLRLTVGNQIELVDGKGMLFMCEIIDDHPKRCSVKVLERRHEDSPSEIHIAICPTKQSERIEWFVEKATEIGVTKISFIECANMERTRLKLDRLQKKAISAMKQSKRLHLPELVDMVKLESFIKENPDGLIAHCYENEKQSISDSYSEGKAILIGPEGDFTQDEINLAFEHGYSPISLGESRLRTETAAIVATVLAAQFA